MVEGKQRVKGKNEEQKILHFLSFLASCASIFASCSSTVAVLSDLSKAGASDRLRHRLVIMSEELVNLESKLPFLESLKSNGNPKEVCHATHVFITYSWKNEHVIAFISGKVGQ